MNKERIGRVLENMETAGLDQIIITATAPVYYLTGLWIDPHERMMALYLHKSGQAVFFGNELFYLGNNPSVETVLHSDRDDPLQGLAGILRPGKLGIDKLWASKFLIGLMGLRPDIHPVNGSGPVDLARRYKDRREIEALRHASSVNDKTVERAISAIRKGICENELAALINKTYRENGADQDGEQLVCFGANASDPHHGAEHSVIRPGDCVVLDISTPISRYWCDMTRTVFYGRVDTEAKKVYETVLAANLAGTQAVAPGVPLSEIDGAARNVIADAGYGAYFTHRLGHGIGLECHESPDVSASSGDIAEPGMVFSIEPGIYLPGKLGIRLEDLVLVTENGCQVLNRASKELCVINR